MEEHDAARQQTESATQRQPLRLWPGVVVVVLQWLIWLLLPRIEPSNTAGYISAIGGVAGGLLVIVWWLFFSRAPRRDRWGALLLMIAAVFVTSRFLHVSVATGGMGLLFYFYVIPGLSLAFVAWAVVFGRRSDRPRRIAMVVTILLACGVWTLFRTRGVSGEGSDFTWRWTQTYEEKLLAQNNKPAALSSIQEAGTDAEWPGFRGPRRDGIVRNVRIDTDWSSSPPAEMWRRPIGPGWSSFAVSGELIYTQEQRGEDEDVACYRLSTGEPVWRHKDAARFWESNAGAGPRATPTLSDGHVYTFGATGILNVLDAVDGTVVWSKDVSSDAGVKVPYWGFAGSPLVVDDLVVVAAAGRLVAYDRATGDRKWLGPEGGQGYSSPQLMTIDGTPQVLLASGVGTTSLAMEGNLLWKLSKDGSSIVQPAMTANGDVLIGSDTRMRRISVANGTNGWTVQERWNSNRLKPYFNDFVVHKGYAFGFDGSILACIDLNDGERKWKGGRYGQGQLVLLPEQDLLLVTSEKGELVLVQAKPDQFTEVAKFQAIEGKTWNHPVVVRDILLVRNGQEMAAFRISPAKR